MSGAGTAGPILVYDGDCAFCARSVRFIVRRDRHRTVRYAARGGRAGGAVRERHPHLRDVDSLIWVEQEGGRELPRIRSDAILAIARYLGGPWAALARLGALVPRPLRDLGYHAVAKSRRRLAFGGDACIVFTEEERRRVLA